MMSKLQRVNYCDQCQVKPKICSPGPWQVYRVDPPPPSLPEVEFGLCSCRHLWRWASTAPIVWEIGIMPLYLEARDVVTFWQREKNALLYLSQEGCGKEKEGCQKGLLSPRVLCYLIYSSFHFTQLSPFSTMTNAFTWILVSAAGPFLQSPLHSGSLGQIPPFL